MYRTKRFIAGMLSLLIAVVFCSENLRTAFTATAETQLTSEWTSVSIGGGGFVTGVIAGQHAIYARMDVGGAYRYEGGKWKQMMNFVSPGDVGLLSVDGLAIDPTDDKIIYLLCGCSYFSSGKTEILRSRDGGETFTRADITGLIRVHGNGDGRQNGERIAVDPNAPNIIYAGGRAGGLIRSQDSGKTWEMVTDLGVMNNWVKWADGNVNTTDNQCGIVSVVIDPASGKKGQASSRIFAAASVKGKANVFVSEDSGNTFAPLSAQLPQT